ncbi:hypothetical protein [Leekyejoonella antrihumi]|uniref:hypothetical protein n=1 Tax=Leekyejoonella antrihumi TaxID=1660198 RepID=UPI001C96CA32|nr:hypothetical protein [Leekyejoonella antrihumi]
MYSRLEADATRTPLLLQEVRDLAVRSLAELGEQAVATKRPGSARSVLTADGAGLEGALRQFQNRWKHTFSTSPGPRYLGFVVGGATPAAIAGDWLTSVFDQNAMSEIGSGAAAFERETLDWIRQLLSLPASQSGAFVSGATMSNDVGLAIARE